MQLTTPEAKEYDTVFPGENWFFFWRTSPSLWESKLREYQGPSPVFIPIFWGLHSENPDQLDFGNYRPETDLKRLFECAKNVGKEVAFLLPLDPAPYLPNGGLPSYLARSMVVDSKGLAVAAIDNDGRLNKLYSFFDPRVFQSFRKFCSSFGRYLSENAIACEVYGAQGHFIQGGKRKSFFEDHSGAFERGFGRYLAQLKEDGELPQNAKNEPGVMHSLTKSYSNQIQSLYAQAASEGLSANWSGELNFAFLGGATQDIFERSSELWEHSSNFFAPLLEMTTLNLIPSSTLLSPAMKKNPLSKALKDIVNEAFIRSHMENDLYEDEYLSSFNPVVFFELFTNGNNDAYTGCGLINFLSRQFPWAYRLREDFNLNLEEEYGQRVRFFHGNEMGQVEFNKVLKLFMNGSRIFLDTTGLNEDFARKLESFVIENNLKEEKINYISPVSKIQLGEGMIVTFKSEKLQEVSMIKKLNFWETLISYLSIRHLDVQVDENVFFLWYSRASNAYELDYEEIRRVSVYNTTSYKKKARIVGAKNFAFLKTVDQRNVEIKSTPLGIDIQMLPGASVSLDFGFYE
ncbi:MAG: beta-galactosidase [Bacteriovoracaceae bacterium]|nr:beta-galactosidase [Bacteriovoracaceae bacterium]